MESNITNIEPHQILTVDDTITIAVDELVELTANPIETVLNQTFFNHRNKTGRFIDEDLDAFDELRLVFMILRAHRRVLWSMCGSPRSVEP